MATSVPAVNTVKIPYYMQQLEFALLLNLYQSLHGGDPFSGNRAAAEGIALGLVSYLSDHTGGGADNIVENLAKMNLALTVTVDGNSEEVKSTKHYRDLMGKIQSGSNGPKTVMICTGGLHGKGPLHCWPLSLQVRENTQP